MGEQDVGRPPATDSGQQSPEDRRDFHARHRRECVGKQIAGEIEERLRLGHLGRTEIMD